jgi:hypothetical protein
MQILRSQGLQIPARKLARTKIWIPAQVHTGKTQWGYQNNVGKDPYGNDGDFESPRPLAAIPRDAKRCKFSGDECREFTAAKRLQIPRSCPSPPPLRRLANCLPALNPPLQPFHYRFTRRILAAVSQL